MIGKEFIENHINQEKKKRVHELKLLINLLDPRCSSIGDVKVAYCRQAQHLAAIIV